MKSMDHKGVLIVVSGFAGTGKGTLMKELLSQYDNYVLSVSATTRLPRPGEVDGVHYFFCDKSRFEQMIADQELLEHAQYVGNYYGTPRAFVESQRELGKDVILEIEIQGALEIKKKYPEAVLLFVMPPSATELKRRLVNRGTETPEVIEQRLQRANEEAKGIENYDYIVINDDLEECVKELHGIIQAAHFTPSCKKDWINQMRQELKMFLKGE